MQNRAASLGIQKIGIEVGIVCCKLQNNDDW